MPTYDCRPPGNSSARRTSKPEWVASRHRRRLEHRTIAVGDYNLEDHWHLGEARAALATGRSNVVMQQGPSALPESQADLRRWATTFADAARAAGTRPALLTVWPESYRQDAIVDVIASYRRATQAAGAELLPAGAAWREAWRCNPRLPLYGLRASTRALSLNPQGQASAAVALGRAGHERDGAAAADQRVELRRRSVPRRATAWRTIVFTTLRLRIRVTMVRRISSSTRWPSARRYAADS